MRFISAYYSFYFLLKISEVVLFWRVSTHDIFTLFFGSHKWMNLDKQHDVLLWWRNMSQVHVSAHEWQSLTCRVGHQTCKKLSSCQRESWFKFELEGEQVSILVWIRNFWAFSQTFSSFIVEFSWLLRGFLVTTPISLLIVLSLPKKLKEVRAGVKTKWTIWLVGTWKCKNLREFQFH